jgi:hypothetical protein
MIFGGYSRPVVADRELKTICNVAPGNADYRIGAHGSGKLDRIADEVHEDLLQRHAFRLDSRELVGHLYPHLRGRREEFDDIPDKRACLHRLWRRESAARA